MRRCFAQSGGNFEVTIIGSGAATLNDVRQCALAMTEYVRDPHYWIHDAGHDYDYTRFLVPDHPQFPELAGCARQYVSSPDHRLVLYGGGWVCPLTIRPVYGTAAPTLATPRLCLGVALFVVCVGRLLA